MTTHNNATAEETPEPPQKLAGLRAVVEEAASFAIVFPEPFRGRIFDLALAELQRAAPALTPAAGAGPATVTPIVTGGLSVVARELGVEPRLLARVVEVTPEGVVSVLGRVEGRSMADRAVQYAVVYLFIKEKALNQLDSPIDDLRALAKKNGCYDGPNFTAGFRRSDLLNPLGGDGAERKYRLSSKGVDEAKGILKKMLEQ